jgi:hypothetical protein
VHVLAAYVWSLSNKPAMQRPSKRATDVPPPGPTQAKMRAPGGFVTGASYHSLEAHRE